MKIIGACLVAVFALAAVAVSSASAAEPEWGRCVSAKKGHYKDANCQEKDEKNGKGKGKFEWVPGAQSDCIAQKKGKYKESKCETLDEKNGKAKGKYEKTGGGKFAAEGGAGV